MRDAIQRGLADPDFGVGELADAVSQDRSHLFRRVKQLFGESPSDLIRRMRVEEGERLLLADGSATVTDVAYAVGFNSLSYFCRCFQEAYGVTPAAYRSQATATADQPCCADATHVARNTGRLKSQHDGSVSAEAPDTVSARSNSGDGHAHESETNHMDRGGRDRHGLWTDAGCCTAERRGAADGGLARSRRRQTRTAATERKRRRSTCGRATRRAWRPTSWRSSTSIANRRTTARCFGRCPLPPPGNIGNEPHHCHTSADQTILACGGLLSVLKGQNDIFFFDITDARHPKFLSSTRAPNSSITDDFLALPGGGFLVTNMGSASGGAGGRVVEFDKNLNLVAEYPAVLAGRRRVQSARHGRRLLEEPARHE